MDQLQSDWLEMKEKLEERAKDTFWDYLGCDIISLNGEEAEISLDVEKRHQNGLGILHGGVSATMLDNVMGIMALASRPHQKVVTTNLNVHYVAPFLKGKIIASAKIIHQSRKGLTIHGKVADEEGNMIAYGTGSFRVIS